MQYTNVEVAAISGPIMIGGLVLLEGGPACSPVTTLSGCTLFATLPLLRAEDLVRPARITRISLQHLREARQQLPRETRPILQESTATPYSHLLQVLIRLLACIHLVRVWARLVDLVHIQVWALHQ